MGKPFGNPEQLELAGCIARLQMEARPLPELGGIAAKVNGDIPDVAREDSNELALGFTKLIMQATENSLCGEGLIILHELGGEAG